MILGARGRIVLTTPAVVTVESEPLVALSAPVEARDDRKARKGARKATR